MTTDRVPVHTMAENRRLLEKYGLRWAVLAAWADELSSRDAVAAKALARPLEAARIKLSSGCFTSCEVGCLLGEIEGGLTAADGAHDADRVPFWLDRLAMAMSDATDPQVLLGIPAVKVHYQECLVPGCACRG